MKELARLEHLEVLILAFTNIKGHGLMDLAPLAKLEALYLSVQTEEGLKGLAPLQQLRALHLSGSEVTDAGLRELSHMKGLKILNFSRNSFLTEDGIAAFKAALPDCQIYR
jgi:hypothetical protein